MGWTGMSGGQVKKPLTYCTGLPWFSVRIQRWLFFKSVYRLVWGSEPPPRNRFGIVPFWFRDGRSLLAPWCVRVCAGVCACVLVQSSESRVQNTTVPFGLQSTTNALACRGDQRGGGVVAKFLKRAPACCERWNERQSRSEGRVLGEKRCGALLSKLNVAGSWKGLAHMR